MRSDFKQLSSGIQAFRPVRIFNGDLQQRRGAALPTHPRCLEGDHAMTTKPLLILASAMLSSLLVAGCGGGGSGNDVAEQPQPSSRSAAPASVQLEGCVVSPEWMGAPGTAVHVRTADGRIVGTAFTNPRGVFVVTVPARTDIVLTTVAAGSSEISLNTGGGSFSLGACLLADL
jgi:hypothetical protein